MKKQLKITSKLPSKYKKLSVILNSAEYKNDKETEVFIMKTKYKMKNILKNKNLTQEYVSKKMGIKQSQLSRMLNGNSGFSITLMNKFCYATNTKIELIENVK